MSKAQIDLTDSKVLVVDDKREDRKLLLDLLAPRGYKILMASDAKNALKIAVSVIPDLILLDVLLPDLDGFSVCQRLKQDEVTADIPVIFMTAYRTEEIDVVKGFRVGGVDYITKPFKYEEVFLRVKTYLQNNLLMRQLEAQNKQLRIEIARRSQAEKEREQVKADLLLAEEQLSLTTELSSFGLIGRNVAFKRKILERIQKLYTTDTTSVLITGESGTGKELIARAIHRGTRQRGPFIAFNCSVFSKELVESELFGIGERVATGVDKRPGKFELADGGTIFLDEIGDMPLEIQAKILRVLEEREVERVGSSSPKRIDVRVIAATNKNLQTEIASGNFREDLYYRLNVFPIEAPPLRERKEDISLLALHLIRLFAKQKDVPPAISPEAVSMLKGYNFPGNVRELKNIIERALIESDGGEIRPEHLDITTQETTATAESANNASHAVSHNHHAVPRNAVAEENEILEYVRQHDYIDKKIAIQILDTDQNRASFRLRQMSQQGKLVREGEKRGSYYVLPGVL